ncbi:PadR family transcriptional regulator [Clostridium sp. P21]|uniref:PadR family transcriptional regulator n=1 Tax=Clostridium muellerianum TaxID=2716538 RepID=A0A7Y0EI99_9CLOT|nr:PadR family transcriptional regulator [Clostridium muellerianum]NMM63968.1 PadR family transcriptional regulator [Clostridium muellerianum]
MNIQFKKGVLELCVLAELYKREFYGYELVEEISKHIDISEGSIYPLLRRLRSEGYVTTYLQESSDGPPRKYYRLTPLGKEKGLALISEWINFVSGVQQIVESANLNNPSVYIERNIKEGEINE